MLINVLDNINLYKMNIVYLNVKENMPILKKVTFVITLVNIILKINKCTVILSVMRNIHIMQIQIDNNVYKTVHKYNL